MGRVYKEDYNGNSDGVGGSKNSDGLSFVYHLAVPSMNLCACKIITKSRSVMRIFMCGHNYQAGNEGISLCAVDRYNAHSADKTLCLILAKCSIS